jgi:transcriptional regulator of acetoin/glycerol metabolism
LRVVWVSESRYRLSDGSIIEHPFRLSDKWTVTQMQTVLDWCHHDDAPKPWLIKAPERAKPVFRPDIGRDEVIQALEECEYYQDEAAKLLGIKRGSLWNKIKKYGITHPRWYRNKEEF